MNFPSVTREISSFHAAALILGGAALVSKLLGLLRDRLLASRFGAGVELDVYYAAFQIPDVLYTIFLIGAAAAAVLPVFMEYERRSAGESEAFVSNLLTVFSIAGSVLVAVAIIAAPWLMRAVAPGFGPEQFRTAVWLTRLMMVNAVFLGVAGILSSVLQARHRFVAFALPPIFYNLGIIAGILFFVPRFGLSGLVAGVVAGGLAQIAVQLPTLRRMAFRIRPRLDWGEPGLRRVVKTSFPRVLAITMSQLTLVALAAIASFFSSGSISVFKLAANLAYVPVGLFGVSYALAVFPKLSGATIEGRGETFGEHVRAGVRTILFWVVPCATLAIVLRAHIVRVVLGSGAFDWEDTRLVAAVVAVLAIAMVSESILPLILRAFYALGRTRAPLFWDVVGSLATVLLAIALAAWFRESPEALSRLAGWLRVRNLPNTQVLAVAIAFAIGSLLNVVLLGLALKRAAASRLGVRLSFEWSAGMTVLGASVLAGLAAYGTLQPFPDLVPTNTFAGIFLQGVVAGAVGLFVYSVALVWQRNDEILGLVESIRRRLISPKRTPEVFEAEKLDGEGTK